MNTNIKLDGKMLKMLMLILLDLLWDTRPPNQITMCANTGSLSWKYIKTNIKGIITYVLTSMLNYNYSGS